MSLPKNFCMAPFTHSFITPQSERRLCCASREASQSKSTGSYLDKGDEASDEYAPLSLKDHWNSEFMKRVRRDMLTGTTVPECDVCDNQILNLNTYRQWFNTLFKHEVDEVIAATDADGTLHRPTISFDYRINNLCNFKCRICGPQLSSSWEAENRLEGHLPAHEHHAEAMATFQRDVVEVELKEACASGVVKEIYWVGGEPLMWGAHWEIMDEMVRSGHSKTCYVRYNTNLSRIDWRGKNLFRDLVPHFQDYLMLCSIDAIGPIGEYLRTGLDWNKFRDFYLAGLAVPSKADRMKMDLTLTLPGLFNMKEFFDFAVENDTFIETKIVYAFEPERLLSPFAIPRDILHPILDDLISYMEPRMSWKTERLVSTLREMKNRQTFDELYPDTFEEGFMRGRDYLRDLAQRRQDGRNGRLTIEEIYETNPEVFRWWMRNG